LLSRQGFLVRDGSCMAERADPSVVLMQTGAASVLDPTIAEQIAAIRELYGKSAPVAVIAESDSAEQALAALQSGLAGFIPSGMPGPLLAAAVRLIAAGGTFLPPKALARFARIYTPPAAPALGPGMLTSREAAVRDALLEGKPNKVIARELGISESTVKIHIRNIMRKMNVSNRTQIVCHSQGERLARVPELHLA
jgi:DNA-binding NarL/FixJ family response regulator